MVQTLPPQYQPRTKSTYEQFVEEGMEIGFEIGFKQGFEIGFKQGFEKGIHNLILYKSSFTDQEIAAMLEVELVQVQKVRANITGQVQDQIG